MTVFLLLCSEKADGDRSAFKPTGEVTATLVAPDGTPVPMTLKVGADGQFTADFNSPFIGDHTLKVLLNYLFFCSSLLTFLFRKGFS